MLDQCRSQIKATSIPYPDRYLLELEIQQDLEYSDVGVEPAHVLSVCNLAELEEIHSTKLHLYLRQFGDWRVRVEVCMAYIPLMLSVIFFFKEDAMISLIREGGAPVMSVILVIGLFLLGREGLNVFRLLLVKDHSPKNLNLDTSSVLLGCVSLVFIAAGQTAFGIYKTAEATNTMPYPSSTETFLMGLKESMAPVVIGTLLAALIILAHYGTRQMMRRWQAPIVG